MLRAFLDHAHGAYLLLLAWVQTKHELLNIVTLRIVKHELDAWEPFCDSRCFRQGAIRGALLSAAWAPAIVTRAARDAPTSVFLVVFQGGNERFLIDELECLHRLSHQGQILLRLIASVPTTPQRNIIAKIHLIAVLRSQALIPHYYYYIIVNISTCNKLISNYKNSNYQTKHTVSIHAQRL